MLALGFMAQQRLTGQRSPRVCGGLPYAGDRTYDVINVSPRVRGFALLGREPVLEHLGRPARAGFALTRFGAHASLGFASQLRMLGELLDGLVTHAVAEYPHAFDNAVFPRRWDCLVVFGASIRTVLGIGASLPPCTKQGEVR
jgi:hypothetical protein